MKRLWCAFVAVLMQSLFVFPVSAEQQVQPGSDTPSSTSESNGVTPSPPSGPANVPAVSHDQNVEAEPVVQEKTRELLQVEGALGRNMGREYAGYLSRTGHTTIQKIGFAVYLRDKYRSKQIAGIVLVGAVAPLLANLTVFGTFQIYRHGLRDDGGFCNHVYYDSEDDRYDTHCEGDRVEVAGIVVVSSIGGLSTLGVLIPGIVNIVKYSKRLRRITHLASRANTIPSNVRFDYAVGPGAALRFRF